MVKNERLDPLAELLGAPILAEVISVLHKNLPGKLKFPVELSSTTRTHTIADGLPKELELKN